MSVFSPTNSPRSATGQILSNRSFWPDIAIDDFRSATRQADTITDARVTHALITAMIRVNGELAAWRLQRQNEGLISLDQVPGDDYNGVRALVHHYHTAVYAEAKAQLIEYYKDAGTTEEGLKRFIQFTDPVDAYRREARTAIRAILGKSRATIELI